MELNDAIALLTTYNRWRRGEDESLDMPNPREIGVALDTVLAAVIEGGTGNSGAERPEPSPHFLQKGDTPETDNLARGNHVVPTEWAEQLERERDEARAEAARLREAGDKLHLRVATMLRDWNDGDFALPALAATHMRAIEADYRELGKALAAVRPDDGPTQAPTPTETAILDRADRLERERDEWEETARIYCQNSDYHREMREKAERERDEARQQERIHYDNLHEARSLAQAGYAKAERAEKMLRHAAAKADEWRECAEGLADAFRGVPYDPYTVGGFNAQKCKEALAEYRRLKEGGKRRMKNRNDLPAPDGCRRRLVRPWVGKLHHARDLCDDWGFIRDESGKLIITVPVTVPHDEWAEHRRNNTDPTQPIVDAILAALNGPNNELNNKEGGK